MNPLFLLPLLSAPAAAQAAPARVALFLGPPGGQGDVVLVEESGLGAPQPVAGLADIQLLPIDASGRSAWTSLLADAPRLRLDVAGGARILLPGEQGSLYRYRRDTAGGAMFGFFRVAADGAVTVAQLELAGTGPSGDQDPFLERVGVDAAGAAVLVATTPQAGGDLYEIALASGAAANRTATLAPLSFHSAGGRLFASFGAAVAGAGPVTGIVRFDRAPGATGALVPIAGIAAPAYWDGGIVASADGSTAATIAGSAATAAHVLVFGASGDARALDAAPQHLSGAGFLPSSTGGPYLALSTDGSHAAWRTVVTGPASSREVWLGRVSTLPGPAPEQLTADAHFVDTLDESGLIGFVSPSTAIVGVGEQDVGSTAIEGVDLYAATLNMDGTTTIANLSLTSGDTLEPFTKGSLSTEEGIFLLDGGQVLALNDDTGVLGRVVLGAPGFQPLLPLTKKLNRIERAGPRLLIEARHETAAVDEKVYAFDPASGALTLLGSLPSDVVLSRHATRADGVVAFVVSYFGKEWIARADLVALSGGLPTSLPLVFGPALALSASGNLALTIGAPSSPAYAVVWTALGGVALLPVPFAPAQVLPGAS